MNKGFTLIELVLMVVVLGVLGAFTFSVIWQYSSIYADAKGGYIYGEAAAVLERITREIKDANNVDTASFSPNPNKYFTFQLTHGTPAKGWTDGNPPYQSAPQPWVQYCICTTTTPGGNTRALLYRVEFTSGSPPFSDQCQSSCPTGSGVLMSGNVMSSHMDNSTVAKQGFRVKYIQGNAGGSGGPESDTYEITLALAADRTRKNLQDGSQYTNNQSTTLVSRVSPRNYTAYDPTNNPSGIGSDRVFGGGYYDRIK